MAQSAQSALRAHFRGIWDRKVELVLWSKEPEAHAYTDGASTGSRDPGSYGAVLTWKGKTEEISGGEHQVVALATAAVQAPRRA
jgi:hypothetical protein